MQGHAHHAVSSAHQVPQMFLAFYTRITATNEQLPKFLMIPYTAQKFLPTRIEPTSHPLIELKHYNLDHGTVTILMYYINFIIISFPSF